MLTVGADSAAVESELVTGRLSCPDCGGQLWPWGWARRRVLRSGSGQVEIRPRRARCSVCEVSHVLLPVFALVRRADLVELIGAALAAKASGTGTRAIAARLGRPADTVRGWLRRFSEKAEDLRLFFTVLLVDVGIDPVPPTPTGTRFADAFSAIAGLRFAAASRWPNVGEVSPWTVACAVSNGRLLSPDRP